MDRLKEASRLLSIEMPTDTTLVIFTLVFIVTMLIYRKLAQKRYNLPPGPPTKFHYGNLKDFDKDPKIYLTLDGMAKQYGSIYRVYTGPRLVVVLNTYDVVKEALVKKQIDFSGRPRNLSNEIQSDGYHGVIFAPYSGRWKVHRKMFNQALRNFATGDNLVSKTHESVVIASEFLRPHLARSYDPFEFITLIVYNFICSMCVGKMFHPDDEEYKNLVFHRRSIADTIGNGFDADFFPYKKVLETSRVNKARHLVNQLLNYAKNIIEDHRKDCDPGVNNFTDYILALEDSRKDTVGNLKLTDRHLINTLMDIFSAGTETTVHTLYWVLLYVTSYPDVQKKLHRQIDKEVGRNTRIDLQQKKKLPYVDATVFEVMRHRPTVPLGIPRSTICDTTIGDYDIPKNTDIIMNVWRLHHDPEVWGDPESFRPERFLEEDGSLGPKPENFLPFGAGRRVCLGESVAKPEICLITAILLQKYRFTLPPGRGVSFEPADLAFTSYSKRYELIIEER